MTGAHKGKNLTMRELRLKAEIATWRSKLKAAKDQIKALKLRIAELVDSKQFRAEDQIGE